MTHFPVDGSDMAEKDEDPSSNRADAISGERSLPVHATELRKGCGKLLAGVVREARPSR